MNKGAKHTDETKQRMAEAKRGRKLADDTKEKMRTARRAWWEKKRSQSAAQG
jgi:hypothetical protein